METEVTAVIDIEIGDVVEYVDEFAKPHLAIVTSKYIGAAAPAPSINVVFVSDNENETDQYGRQIKRETSVVPEANQAAHGRFWREVVAA